MVSVVGQALAVDTRPQRGSDGDDFDVVLEFVQVRAGVAVSEPLSKAADSILISQRSRDRVLLTAVAEVERAFSLTVVESAASGDHGEHLGQHSPSCGE